MRCSACRAAVQRRAPRPVGVRPLDADGVDHRRTSRCSISATRARSSSSSRSTGRARRRARSTRSLSTLFFVFASFGVAARIWWRSSRRQPRSHLSPAAGAGAHRAHRAADHRASTSRLGTAFSVFGGVINGFQRYDLNNIVGHGQQRRGRRRQRRCAAGRATASWSSSLATTTVRVLTYLSTAPTPIACFPALRIRLVAVPPRSAARGDAFSVYMPLIDWANKLNYSHRRARHRRRSSAPSAVAVWTVGQRLAELTQRLTNQLNDVLFPDRRRQRRGGADDGSSAIFVQGTRLSLATVVPMAGGSMLMADPLVHAWVGPEFAGSVIVAAAPGVDRRRPRRQRDRDARCSRAPAGTGSWPSPTSAPPSSTSSLSIALVKPLGLAGVAIGTLVPVALACDLRALSRGLPPRRPSVRRALREAVWPAVWPAR